MHHNKTHTEKARDVSKPRLRRSLWFAFGATGLAVVIAAGVWHESADAHWPAKAEQFGAIHGGKFHEFSPERSGGRRALEARFDAIDSNGDRALSVEEMKQAHQNRFEDIDANGDAGVSAEELANHLIQQRSKRAISHRDTDGDGMLSLAELPDRSADMMKFDLDENGVVTKTELKMAMKAMRGHRRRGHGDHAGRKRGKHASD